MIRQRFRRHLSQLMQPVRAERIRMKPDRTHPESDTEKRMLGCVLVQRGERMLVQRNHGERMLVQRNHDERMGKRSMHHDEHKLKVQRIRGVRTQNTVQGTEQQHRPGEQSRQPVSS